MKLNTPLPQPLPKECEKAAKIFKSFVDSGNNGLDGIIPRHVLENAKGFAIFTIIKAGFLFSARAGSGIVIAKLDNGTWSAPSAIGTAGLGLGGQAGAEMTDFLVVLNSRSAVRSFMSAGSVTLGGNMSIAVGPLGRNGEALGSLNTSGKVAAMYSYSKTRGLFGGISVEGSVIVERQDANALAYSSDVTAKMLLSGVIDAPGWATPLIQTLEACTGMPGGHKWIQEQPSGETRYAFGNGVESPGNENGPSSARKKKRSLSAQFPPAAWGRRKNSGSYFTSDFQDDPPEYAAASSTSNRVERESGTTSAFPTQFESDFSLVDTRPTERPPITRSAQSTVTPRQSTYNPGSPFNDLPPFPNAGKANHGRSFSAVPYSSVSRTNPFSQSSQSHSLSNEDWSPDVETGLKPHLTSKKELSVPLSPHEGVARAIALYEFNAVESGDLSFRKGEVITITKKSHSVDDWWTGKIDGREGIFPANFVEVV
ncbi:DUF500-domain-containing protein [Rickenella mellea]|uniref:DUF500-domain-containing protein n=1 Tax=Rickenella mellea TaxID=50990 RepID=A0A4Y7QNA5_9AGAM|nr:DUF500-domain-containing protein [Rickenella mellea]